MKILILNYFDPYNDNNGSVLRINGVIRALQNDHELFVYSLGDKEFTHTRGKTTYVTIRKTTQSKLHKIIVFMLGKSVLLDRTFNKALDAEVEKLLKDVKIDLIIAESVYMAQYIPEEMRYWVDQHNVEYDLLLSYLKEKKTLLSKVKSLYLKHESSLVRRYEVKTLKKAERVLCVNSCDQKVFQTVGVQADIVPNTIDVKGIEIISKDSELTDIVFIGAMNYYPNEYGVLYFVDNVLPLIREKGIDATLWIVGAKPSRKVIKLGEREGIEVTGWVELDKLIDYYRKAGVFIAPMYIGGGSATKIVHAMAHSIVVVTTMIGADKIEFLENNVNVLVACNDNEFADHVSNVLKNNDLRRRVGKSARKAVEQHVDYSVVKGLLDKYI